MSQERELSEHARRIRRRILRLTSAKGVGHTGGSLSLAEILTVLYFHAMNIDPAAPQKPERDRLILSKGHATPGYYSALAERGYFGEEQLFAEYDEIDGHFQGHPDMRKTPGVDMSTGSLGQGLSIGIGLALGMQRRKLDARAYVLLGDGELQEGQLWEAFLYAGSHKVTRLVAIVDDNGLQLTAPTGDIMKTPAMLESAATAFGWSVLHCDGHDLPALVQTLDSAKALSNEGPCLVIAKTVKGKGISFIENRVEWHARACTPAELALALAELE